MGLVTSDQRVIAEGGVDASQLVWTGRPARGIRLLPADALAIPLSLLWGGFAFFWEYMVVTGGAPWFFRLWGIPFVAVGLYLIVGRFFWDAYIRERTYYGLTNSGQAIIRRTTPRASTTIIDLRRVSEVALRTEARGEGTIYFGPEPSFFSETPFANRKPQVPQFRSIAEAAHVFQLCKKLQTQHE